MSFKVLQIGVGIRGGHWAEIVRDHPVADPVGYVDVSPEALEKVKRTIAAPGARYFTDLAEALRETDAVAAIIATPSAHHVEHAVLALQAGLAVMVEKPFALDVADAERVLEEATRVGKPVMAAENYRFWRSERTVRHLLEEAFLGSVDHATLVDRRNMPSHTEGPWLATIQYPQLQEIAIHHFDSLRSFFRSPPTAITARAWNPPWSDYRHGACTEGVIEFGDLHVQYLGTMTSHRFSFSLWIEGERGVLWTNRKYVLWRPGGSRFFRPVKRVEVPKGDDMPYPKGGTTSLLEALRDAALHGREAETSGRDNIWNVAMVQAGKLSDREGRRVSIDEVYRPSAA